MRLETQKWSFFINPNSITKCIELALKEDQRITRPHFELNRCFAKLSLTEHHELMGDMVAYRIKPIEALIP